MTTIKPPHKTYKIHSRKKGTVPNLRLFSCVGFGTVRTVLCKLFVRSPRTKANGMLIYDLISTASAERLCGFTATVFLVMRREESVHGELNFAEGFARVIGIATAFFLRNAEIVSGNEHLHIAL